MRIAGLGELLYAGVLRENEGFGNPEHKPTL